MKKNTTKVIAYFFISLLVFTICINAYAITEDELKNKQDEINRQIEEANTEIAGIKENMTFNLDQINKLNIQIKELEDLLAQTNEKLDGLNKELEENKKELLDAKKNYDKQKSLIDKRLITIYESSKTTYLDVLLTSTSFSDFLNKYYMLNRLAEYDNKLLQSLDVYESAVEIKSKLVENKRDEIQNTKDTVESKTGAIQVLIEDKNNLILNLSQREIELNDQLEQFEVDKKDIENQLIQIAKQKSITKSITPSQSGYISPLVRKNEGKYYNRVLWIFWPYRG